MNFKCIKLVVNDHFYHVEVVKETRWFVFLRQKEKYPSLKFKMKNDEIRKLT